MTLMQLTNQDTRACCRVFLRAKERRNRAAALPLHGTACGVWTGARDFAVSPTDLTTMQRGKEKGKWSKLHAASAPWTVQRLDYLFLFPGLGLHSSPMTGCNLILIGYAAVFPLYPLLQS
jgi:hypothetical protein